MSGLCSGFMTIDDRLLRGLMVGDCGVASSAVIAVMNPQLWTLVGDMSGVEGADVGESGVLGRESYAQEFCALEAVELEVWLFLLVANAMNGSIGLCSFCFVV